MKYSVRRLFAITAVAVLMLLLSSRGAHARGPVPPGGPGGGFERMVMQLDLTDTQKTEIESILNTERTAIEPLFETLRANREALRTLVKSGSCTESDIRTVASQQAATMTDLIVARELAKCRILGILTEEQRSLVEKAMDLVEASPHGPPH